MITLSKGWKKPETGDFGDVWFPALEDNIDQMNSHSHNGTDSERVLATSISASKVTVASGDFSDQGDGYWRATVTVPSGRFIDDLTATVKDPTSQEVVYLRMAKLSTTQFYIYTNIVQNFEVHFGV